MDPRRWRLLVLVLIAIGAPASVGGQDPTTVPVDPPAPTDATADPAAASDDPQRARLDLSLEDAVRLALSHNLDIAIERRTRERVAREETIADAAFDPLFRTSYTLARFRAPSVSQLDFGLGVVSNEIAVNPFENDRWDVGVSGLLKTLGTSYTVDATGSRSDNPESSIFSLNPRYSSGLGIEFTQPLLRGFGDDTVNTQLRIASRDAEISRLELRRRVEDTLVAVVDAYWDLLFTREDLEVKNNALLEAQELLQINQRKLQVGSGTELEVLDAEANIETQRSGIIDAENAVQNAEDRLLDLINAPEYRQGGFQNPLFIDAEIVPTTEVDVESVELSLEESVDRALLQRIEVQQAVLNVLNSQDLVDQAEDSVLPRLDVIAGWRNSGLEEDFGGSWDELFTGTYYDWNLGVVFEVPIGNRAARERRSQARLDRESARLDQARIVNSIVLGVTQAVRDVRSAQQRVQTTRKTTELRQEQLDGEKRRLEVGASTSFQVLQIQQDLLEAQRAEIESQVILLKAMTAYRQRTGDVLPVLGISID